MSSKRKALRSRQAQPGSALLLLLLLLLALALLNGGGGCADSTPLAEESGKTRDGSLADDGGVGGGDAGGDTGGADVSLPPGCEPERCDGLDNDCDGLVDEVVVCVCGWDPSCYAGPPATRGIGECRDGSRRCDDTGEFWGPCEHSRLPAAEVCDMLDNDCDGETDEGCPPPCLELEICGNGLDDDCNEQVDDGCPPPCLDEEICGNGWDDDCDGQEEEGCPPPCIADEICGDGVDNDCNGQTDEGCGPPCGDRELCNDRLDNDCDGQTDEGCAVCDPEESCGDGQDNDCDGDIDEGCILCGDLELCDNGLDDDCDGQTDEGCTEQCAPGLQRGCFSGNPMQVNLGACRAGTQRCVDATLMWGECIGEVLPVEEICHDGVDNDCDGRVDEGCIVCQDVEVCNDGVDNDCDGTVDEDCGNECLPGQAAPCFPGPGNAGVGLCRPGERRCSDRAWWGPCEGAVVAVADACGNGLDEDCDGVADEGCGNECQPGQVGACFPGPGQANVGLCRAGQRTCSERGFWGACVGAIVAVADACGNGLDEDCDGTVDEDCGNECQPGQVESCFPGPGNPDVGLCRSGERRCSDRGFWSACQGAVTAMAEVCGNGVDEDCDGQDQQCGPVRVPIFIIGDCLTVSCPAHARHPVGCTVFFTPGDDRGCVANRPNDPVVYFQAGDECDQGFVTGTLLCSDRPGQGLNAANCPMNKPIQFYPDTPAGCPAAH